MRHRTCIWLMSICLSLTLTDCTRKPAEPQPIAAIAGPVAPPAKVEIARDVLLWAVAGNPQLMLQRAEALAGKAGPIPAGSLGTGIAQALVKLGLKDTSVVDLGAPAGLLMLNPNKSPEPLVVALTTKGPKAVLESLEPVWKSKGEKDGIFELARDVVEPYAVFQGKAAADSQTVQQTLFVKFEGLTALASSQRGALLDGGPQLLERLKAGAPASGMTGTLHLSHLREAFAMQLAMLPPAVKQQLSQGMQAQATLVDPKAMEWILGWLVDKLFAFFNQTRAVGVSLGFEADEVVFHLVLEPEPGSFFSQLLAAQKPASLKLAAGLPQTCFLALGMDVQWGLVRQDMLAFAAEAIEMFTGKPASAEVQALLKEWMDLMGDEVALVESFDEQGALQLVELIQVHDETRARTAMLELMKLADEMYSSENGLMGIRAKVEGPRSLGEHDGVDLQEMVLRMDLTALPEAQAKMMRQVYGGEGFRMVMAVFDKTFALALGAKADADLRAAIDQVRKGTPGLTGAKHFQNAAGGLAEGAGGFVYLSLSQFVTSTLRSTFAMTGAPVPAFKPAEPRSGLFVRARTDQGRLVHSLRLPAAHLEELGLVIQQISALSSGQAH